jgi:hypothetical protein
MKVVKGKTRKAIRKSVKKVIKKHGPQIAAGLAGGIASTLATLANTEAPHSNGKKSNLAALSQKLSENLTGDQFAHGNRRSKDERQPTTWRFSSTSRAAIRSRVSSHSVYFEIPPRPP